MGVDTRITLLVKGGEQMYIYFSPVRGRVVKEIRVNRRVEARNGARGDIRKYRAQIKSAVKWGWVIESSDQEDLLH
jgi:hypothetical protein